MKLFFHYLFQLQSLVYERRIYTINYKTRDYYIFGSYANSRFLTEEDESRKGVKIFFKYIDNTGVSIHLLLNIRVTYEYIYKLFVKYFCRFLYGFFLKGDFLRSESF